MHKIIDFFKKYSQDIFKPVIVLLCICIIIPLALSVTNYITKDAIASNSEKSRNETMARLVDADSFEESTSGEATYYTAYKDKSAVAFIYINQAMGYGGAVEVMTVFDIDGSIKAVDILDASNETPGLGQNVTKKSFYPQYSGKKGEISVVKNGADEEANEINAVTGATISSKAVTAAVNEAVKQFNETMIVGMSGGDAE